MMQKHKTYTVEEAKRALESFCAYQERCHKEVVSKLIAMNMIPEARDVVIGHLIEHNFLNETRFAKAFVHGKFRIKKWGRIRLSRELKFRDISTYNINLALKELSDDTYLATFHDLAEKKASSIRESHPLKKKKKLADYLLYRGWESHLVYDKINTLV